MSFFVFLIIFLSMCFSEQTQENDFYVYHPFRALNSSSVIKELKVQGQLNCALSCSSLSGCHSFNFALKKDAKERRLCQLLPSHNYAIKLQDSDYFHYYEKFNPDPCSSSHPCQNGGKCDVIVGARDFTCSCSPAFVGKFCESDNWTKLNTVHTCFGARDHKYASFTVQRSGVCTRVKLIHISGYVTCKKSDPNGQGYWGCVESGRHLFLAVVITHADNTLALPSRDTFITPLVHAYNLKGFTATSKELVFPGPFFVTNGKEYRIWFGQDLDNTSEIDNDGTVCADVYCLYQ